MSEYNTNVYREQGGSSLVIGAGGQLVIDGDVYSAAALKDLLAIVASIPTADPEVAGEVWFDGTKLVVSEGA